MRHNNNSLNDRMKNNYEERSKMFLTRRTPVIIRLDGKAFHTFTRGLKRPYDEVFHEAMNNTLKYLCENIQGCKFGYTQSDEISLLLTDYDTLQTDSWFNYNVQKMCSVSASMATLAFNKFFIDAYSDWMDSVAYFQDFDIEMDYIKTIEGKFNKAMFDSRCFNIPEDEVVNCFIWRQQDATRNALQMLGQCYFTNKQLYNKSQGEVQDMLMLEKGINFNNMPTEFKRGVTCIRVNGKWVIDKECPIFTKDRDYIMRWKDNGSNDD